MRARRTDNTGPYAPYERNMQSRACLTAAINQSPAFRRLLRLTKPPLNLGGKSTKEVGNAAFRRSPPTNVLKPDPLKNNIQECHARRRQAACPGGIHR